MVLVFASTCVGKVLEFDYFYSIIKCKFFDNFHKEILIVVIQYLDGFRIWIVTAYYTINVFLILTVFR